MTLGQLVPSLPPRAPCATFGIRVLPILRIDCTRMAKRDPSCHRVHVRSPTDRAVAERVWRSTAHMNLNRRDFRRLAGSFTRANTMFSVLYVDPDLAFAEQLASVLRGRGAVAVVPSANAARAAMRGRMPTLVVMELDLSDASCAELLATPRQAPATRNMVLM